MSKYDEELKLAFKQDERMRPVIANVPYFGVGEKQGWNLVKESASLEGDAPEEIRLKEDAVNRVRDNYESVFHAALDPEDASYSGRFLHLHEKPYSASESRDYANFLLDVPAVYIVYFHDPRAPKGKPWTVYVGETNHIVKRTVQHVIKVKVQDDTAENVNDQEALSKKETAADIAISKAVADGIEVRQYVIWQKLFNKSLTLDIENKLIDYMQSIESVNCLNGRTNPQGRYFTSDSLEYVVSNIWSRLVKDNVNVISETKGKSDRKLCALFPTETSIWNSAIYKISPFHKLGENQEKSLDCIAQRVEKILSEWGPESRTQLILIQGSAGTGKSILLSTLFYKLCNMPTDHRPSVKLMVYSDDLFTQYQDMAKLQGLNKGTPGLNASSILAGIDNVLKPSEFIHALSVKRETQNGQHVKHNYDYYAPTGKADVALVDEAHLLFTQGRQGYQGHNQLHDILRRAKVVVAVFDPNQIMNNTEKWEVAQLEEFLRVVSDKDKDGAFIHEKPVICHNSDNPVKVDETAYETCSVYLTEQFRISASGPVSNWIRQVTAGDSRQVLLNKEPSIFDRDRPHISNIPTDDMSRPDGVYASLDDPPYEIKVFDSPQELADAIEKKRTEINGQQEQNRKNLNRSPSAAVPRDLCRVLATYDWNYSKEKGGEVTLYRNGDSWLMPVDWNEDNKPIAPQSAVEVFSMGWNGTSDSGTKKNGSNKDPWSSRPDTEKEVGSYFTIQGFDLNYAGVIIGPSISYDVEHDCLKFVPEYSRDKKAAVNAAKESGLAEVFVRNQLNVLLTRGVHGLYLFAVDPILQNQLKKASRGEL